MKKRLIALLALALCTVMCLGILAGCKGPTEPTTDPTKAPDATDEPVVTDPVDVTPDPDAIDYRTFEEIYPDKVPYSPETPTAGDNCDPEQPLVVAYNTFSGKFSPFFADTSYDVDVAGMTQIGLTGTDRSGALVLNGIEGEYRTYNGEEYFYYGPADCSVDYDEATDTTKYTAIIRPDMKFSDGNDITIDDVIFTYYLLLDTNYQGSTTLNSYAIQGMNEYRTQTSKEVYDEYKAIAEAILAAGANYTVTDADGFTQEECDAFWGFADEAWILELKNLSSYCIDKYWGSYGAYMPFNADGTMSSADVKANDSYAIMFACWAWGFGDFVDVPVEGAPEPAEGEEPETTTVFMFNDVDTQYPEFNPTYEDFLAEVKVKYNNDPDAYYAVETCDYSGIAMTATAVEKYISVYGQVAMGDVTVPNITGIKKINNYCVEVTVDGYTATAIYHILGVTIAPLHYYGDEAMFNYEDNQFGFPRGDLSIAYSKTSVPVGAGAYKFVSYDNRVVSFEANEYYYRGEPITQYIQFKEMSSTDVPAAMQAGTIDAASDVTGSVAKFAEIASYNSNGELQGDVIYTIQVDNNGYGYVGMNADTMLVDEPGSEASKNLRKGFATVLAVYRDAAIDSYYANAASVIQYPISTVSWASPQAADEGFEIAFSRDVDGNPIYTDGMTADEKYAAALEAAKGFFAAAGYVFGEDGMIDATQLPGSAKVEYEAMIPGDGTGDHPNYHVLTNASAALATIGMTLTVNDLTDSNVLWDALDAGTQEMWTAAWGGATDPDMYQVYYSGNIAGLGGSDSNHYHIQSAELDELVIQARQSDNQEVRKALYKQCLDIILDWAVEVPSYQRKNCTIVSPQRVIIDSLTPEITTMWGWMNDIELIQMYKQS